MTRAWSETAATTGAPRDIAPIYLRRLRRMLAIRYQAARYLSQVDRDLLDRGILSAFLACRSVGLESEAIRTLEIARRRSTRDSALPARGDPSA
jgi:hypothetical protein